MIDSVDKTTKFIAKLVELSQRKKIDWTVSKQGGFTAEVEGRQVRIFSVDRDTSLPMFGLKMLPGKVAVLEIYDEFGRPVYSFSGTAGLGDLLESASFSGGRVDEFMNSVLAAS